jgi:hypothetical protein
MAAADGAPVRSQLFQPFRAVGFVVDDVPIHVKRLVRSALRRAPVAHVCAQGSENFITVSIGRAWQVFNVSRAARSSCAVSRAAHLTAALHSATSCGWCSWVRARCVGVPA